MKSLQGQLLVASPHLADENFLRSVVFMIQHDDEGAFGVVLNRPTNNRLAEALPDEDADAAAADQPIFLGGPVPGPLLILHQEAAHGETEVIPQVFVTTEKEAVTQLLATSPSAFRVFSGYSGWSAGQLESELTGGGWLTTATSAAEVFSSIDDLWERVIRRIGLEIIAPAINKNRVPDDPSVN